MTHERRDAWKRDEDELLTEVVLRYIRNGKTQLEAFKEAGKKLSRTAAACGFRWNATLRKQHIEAIHLAKQQNKQDSIGNHFSEGKNEQLSIDKAISLLESLKMQNSNINILNVHSKKMEQLIDEISELKQRLKQYEVALFEISSIINKFSNEEERVN